MYSGKAYILANRMAIIDVSRRSIEETAAIIMKNFYDHKKYINKLEIE